jgi:serine/threonine protein phosphatase PrpC
MNDHESSGRGWNSEKRSSSENDTALLERIPGTPPARQNPRPRVALLDCLGWTQQGQGRSHNEDFFGFTALGGGTRNEGPALSGNDLLSPQGHAVAVADGMGGAPGGERASVIAVGTYLDFLRAEATHLLRTGRTHADMGETLRRGLSRCLLAFREEERRDPASSGMTTSLTAAVSDGSNLHVIHVGDTRCYVFRNYSLHQLTTDQTTAQGLVEAGILAPAAARKSSWRKVLENFLRADNGDPHPQIIEIPIYSGDVVLLASDGLGEVMDQDEISAALAAGVSAKDLCRVLSEECCAKEPKDDVTVVVARFGPF